MASVSYNGGIHYWWSGSIMYITQSGGGVEAGWYGSGAATFWTFGISCMSGTLLLFYGIHSWKGMKFKWDWLVYALIGIVLIIFPILMFVYDFQSGVVVGFAPIGILIAGILCIGAFILQKFIVRK